MNRIERTADERIAAFQGRSDLSGALLPRSNEFIRSVLVKESDIEVRVRAKTQRSAKHAKNHAEKYYLVWLAIFRRRTAIDTVKIPRPPTSVLTFSKPASLTSSSSSRCVRRRIIQGSPSRFVRTLAIISICGCHGWPV